MTDASVLAFRLDYAVAANLNMFASLFYADRLSHAWQWGFIFPNPDNNGAVTFQNFKQGTSADQEFQTPVPTIPDTNLGWEITVGGKWELLEGFTFDATVAYWWPGRWFNYACVDRQVQNWWANPSPANNWGIDPHRTIDPIMGMEIKAVTRF
jgi:hypothetical protein